ncbi:MAG: M2 family metallopeptidase, partial [Calditrichia bacterium]|nr:M2 family metallopeptidase [Calditrichia bacterium]
GRLSRNPEWMQTMLNLIDEQKTEIEKLSPKYVRLKQLIFVGWAMVMYNFEKQLHANQDKDLNQLWWDMVGKFQLVKQPGQRKSPDWAAKIHFTIAPCYYHNYLLGELFASQFHHTLVHQVLKSKNTNYIQQKQVGDFIQEKIFKPDKMYT